MPKNAVVVLLRYGCAGITIALATWVRLLLEPALGTQFPFATIFFAILVTAWYGGFRPALAAVILGTLSSTYFIAPPRGSFVLDGVDQQIGMGLCCITGIGIAMLGGLMQATRQMAEANARTEARHAALIDQTHDAVLVWDWNGPITFWNRGAERLYGIKRAEALGQVSNDLLHTKLPGGVGEFINALERDSSWEGELEHTTRSGQTIVVESRMVLVLGADRP